MEQTNNPRAQIQRSQWALNKY